MPKLTNPLIDSIFKRIFGKMGQSEEFLIDFLNEIFADDPDFNKIVSVIYGNPERNEETIIGKRIIYDIHCTTSNGHHFLVEMQKSSQRNFMKRAFYYESRLITDQLSRFKEEGEREKVSKYEYCPVVGVFLCDFINPELPKRTLVRSVMSDEQTGKPVSRLMRMAYIQLPLFKKTKEECVTGFDKWIYVLKNMEKLDNLPFEEYKNQIFKRLESVASYAALTGEEKARYDEDWKWAADYNETMAYQYDQGLEQGIEQEKWQTAKILKDKGMDFDFISSVTGLSINTLRNHLK